jgi:hypothetical protein
VRFWAKASAPGAIHVNLSQAHDPWQNLGLSGAPRLTTEWQEFRYVVNASQADDNARLSFSNLGGDGRTVWVTRPSCKPGGVFGLEPAEDLATLNLPLLGRDRFGERTAEAQRDWMRFLYETEELYWTGMLSFLKDELKVQALVTGTIAGCSPLNIQARMDWWTAQYWQHPRWTAGATGTRNWIVENRAWSTSGAEPSAASACGRPWQTTRLHQYNHPAPNTYSSEVSFPLAAIRRSRTGTRSMFTATLTTARTAGTDEDQRLLRRGPAPTRWRRCRRRRCSFVATCVRRHGSLFAAPPRAKPICSAAHETGTWSADAMLDRPETALLHRVGLTLDGRPAPL